MKLIRCIVQPGHVDEIVDALKTSGVSALTVTAGGGWSRNREVRRTVYRGLQYEPRLLPESVIDATTEDDAVDGVVRVLIETFGIGQNGDDARVLVMPVELHRLRAHSLRIA